MSQSLLDLGLAPSAALIVLTVSVFGVLFFKPAVSVFRGLCAIMPTCVCVRRRESGRSGPPRTRARIPKVWLHQVQSHRRPELVRLPDAPPPLLRIDWLHQVRSHPGPELV